MNTPDSTPVARAVTTGLRKCWDCKGTGKVKDAAGLEWRCRYCHGTGRK